MTNKGKMVHSFCKWWVVAMAGLFVFYLGVWVGAKYEKLEYLRIVDGDTFWVANRRDGSEWKVRLWGVNAPDSKECYFEEAGKILENELRNRRIGYQRYGYDGYGRILAKVFVDNQNLEEVLVATGAARVYDASEVHDELKPSTEYINALRELEEKAKAAKLGLWGSNCVK